MRPRHIKMRRIEPRSLARVRAKSQKLYSLIITNPGAFFQSAELSASANITHHIMYIKPRSQWSMVGLRDLSLVTNLFSLVSMVTSEEKLAEVGHGGGVACRCSECQRLKDIEDKWIMRMCTFNPPYGLNQG